MNIREKIKAAIEENESDSLFSFEVPEWSTETEPFIIYHRSFTLDDLSYVDRMSRNDKAKSLAYTVLRKALDENGKKIFSLKDLLFITKSVKSEIIVNIVNNMNKHESGIDYSQE